MVGSGEPVSSAVHALEKAGAAVVLVDGKPAGMITRQDVLTYLARLGCAAAQLSSDAADNAMGSCRGEQERCQRRRLAASRDTEASNGTGRRRAPSTDGFETLAIHAGQDPDPLTGAVVPPIYQVSTYKQDGVGGCGRRGGAPLPAAGSRATSTPGPPTRPGGRSRSAWPRWKAAPGRWRSPPGWPPRTACCAPSCRPGDHVLIPHDAYGGTYRLFDKVLQPLGR